MPLPITCPHCGAAYSVADDLLGRRLRCRDCDEPIVAGESPEPPRRPPRRLALKAVVVAVALLPAGALGVLWWAGCLWDRVDWPNPEFGGLREQEPAVILHVTGVGGQESWKALTDDLEVLADGGRARFLVGAVNGERATVTLAPVRDPDDFARRVTFGTVRRVHDRVITVSLPECDGADVVATALSDLKSDNAYRRSAAARHLLRARQDGNREEVARALEGRLNDPDPRARAGAVEALGAWGTKESAALLLKALDDRETRGAAARALGRQAEAGTLPDERRGEVARALEDVLKEDDGPHEDALWALGRLKDEDSAEPLARCLEDFSDRRSAAEALRALGPAAEKAVARRLSHEDLGVRRAACAVLGDIGTPACVPALDAAAADPQTVRSANEAIRRITARHRAREGQ
jgi:predicted Zn finger-like uncharacterized protein